MRLNRLTRLNTDTMEKDTKILIALKPYSKKELAEIYNVCTRTFTRWIKKFEPEIGKQDGRFYTISQVKLIFKKLGLPTEIAEKEMVFND